MRVLKWIWKNKEWMFSGIGVAVVFAAIKFVSVEWLTAHWQDILFVFGSMLVVGFAIYGFMQAFDKVLLSMFARKKPAPPPTALSGPKRITNVTPEFICAEIGNAPPLQQKTIATAYYGLWVDWTGTLFYAWETADNPGVANLSLRSNPRGVDDIRFAVKKSDYIELMHMREGARIAVQGRISEANPLRVTLEDVELSFPKDEAVDSERAEPAPIALIEAPLQYRKLPKEQIKILQTLAVHEDLIEDKPVSLADLQKRCDLTTTEFKHHSEELRKAKLIYVTHLLDGPYYQNSPAGAGWLINTKQKY